MAHLGPPVLTQQGRSLLDPRNRLALHSGTETAYGVRSAFKVVVSFYQVRASRQLPAHLQRLLGRAQRGGARLRSACRNQMRGSVSAVQFVPGMSGLYN
eukprot:869116-Rhodomonas_salina.2